MHGSPAARRRLAAALAGALALALGGLAAQTLRERSPAVASERMTSSLRETTRAAPIQPVPRPAHQDPLRVALGERLFADRRLSGDGTIACRSCHDLAHGGAEGRPTAVGIAGRLGAMNTPTVFNAALNPSQFWDGRATSLEDQVDGPLQSPDEMGARWPGVIEVLGRDPSYVRAFAQSYGGAITAASIRDAIATYERTLVMRDSRFDRYLAGDLSALDAQELEGFRLFKSYGCASCHEGRNVGGNIFEKLGIFGDYFADRGTEVTPQDLGRYNVTKRPEDRFFFRVPSLRLAPLTPPYLHDGTVATLEEAITVMGRYQLGEEIPPDDTRVIAAFLGTLAGSRTERQP